MKLSIFILLTGLCMPHLCLAAEDLKLETFDFFLEPGGGFGFGSYDVGNSIDSGSIFTFEVGGRGGFKLGPVYIAGEYRTGSPGADSDKNTVSDANRIRYPVMDSGNFVSVGPSLGLQLGRVQVWASYFANSLEQDITYNGVQYTHEYEGSGYRLEVSFNIYKNIHVGLFTQQNEFDEYSSTHPTDTTESFSELDPRLNSTTYGFTFSYFLPLLHVIKESVMK